MTAFETKHDASVGIDRNAPKTDQRALQRMQPPAGQIKVSRLGRAIKARQYALNLIDVLRSIHAGPRLQRGA
jgi:hypothetical protein